MNNKKKPTYPLLQLRDNKEKTWHGKVKEIINFLQENNPDGLEDYETKAINVPYVLKKAINKLHKEYCSE